MICHVMTTDMRVDQIAVNKLENHRLSIWIIAAIVTTLVTFPCLWLSSATAGHSLERKWQRQSDRGPMFVMQVLGIHVIRCASTSEFCSGLPRHIPQKIAVLQRRPPSAVRQVIISLLLTKIMTPQQHDFKNAVPLNTAGDGGTSPVVYSSKFTNSLAVSFIAKRPPSLPQYCNFFLNIAREINILFTQRYLSALTRGESNGFPGCM